MNHFHQVLDIHDSIKRKRRVAHCFRFFLSVARFLFIATVVCSVFNSCAPFPCSSNHILISGNYKLNDSSQGLPMTMMWYNVENLFDTIDNPFKNDQEFLPSGSKQWHRYKYVQKLNHLSEVIASIPSDQLMTDTAPPIPNDGSNYWQMMPAVIGMCEVESKQCLDDLTNRTMLKPMHYRSIITHSSDARGINIALLYDPMKLRLIKSYSLHVDSTLHTRDILVAEMSVFNPKSLSRDSLYLFLNHWPSRRGGPKVSEQKRIRVEQVLINEIQKVRRKNKTAKMIVMGDFNTYASSKELSIFTRDYLMCRLPAEPKSTIHNKMFPSVETRSKILCDEYAITGSYLYQGRWGSLDHVFISPNLVEHVEYSTLFVRDWMLDKGKRLGGYQPRRTYLGPRYIGGYSDHLPLLLYLTF